MDEKQIAALREVFEAEHIGMDLDRHPEHGYYQSKLTQAYWEGFLACYQHLAPMVEDAERYRWLRCRPIRPHEAHIDVCMWDEMGSGKEIRLEELDVHIDAAREQEKKNA